MGRPRRPAWSRSGPSCSPLASSSSLLLFLLLLLPSRSSLRCCIAGETPDAAVTDEDGCTPSSSGGTCASRDSSSDGSDSTDVPDYLIIGAGGSGLQTALFLLQSPHTSSFSILEKDPQTVGSFWSSHPRFDELISINKSVRNQTQRFRYDWHSFLGTELGMLDVTKDYFPTGKDWQRYMRKVVEETPGLGDRLELGVEVERILGPDHDGDADDDEEEATGGTSNNNEQPVCVHVRYHPSNNKGGSNTGKRQKKRCARRRIFIGTGLATRPEPYLRALGGVPYLEATRARAQNRRVCVLGNGNSGFELAQNLYGVADRVTLYGRGPHRLSAVTRYTGDVRVKYLQALENLNGKLLDTVDHFTVLPSIDGEEKLPLDAAQLRELKELIRTAAWLDQFECEAFFYATGVRSVVPGMKDLGGGSGSGGGDGLFPQTESWYASPENDRVHYVGWLMHERDFRRGAGGFFSGYRYLIRNLVRNVLKEDHGVEYPYRLFKSKEEVVAHAVARIQVADDLIILQDGTVLRDVIVPVPTEGGDDNGSGERYRYYEGVTYDSHPELRERGGDDGGDIIYLYLAWGDGKTASHVFDGVWRYTDTRTLINLFLHPVVQVGPSLTREMHEDLDMSWKDPAYVASIEKVMREALDGRLERFLQKKSHAWRRSVINQTEEPGYYEAAPLKTGIDNRVFQAMWKAIYRKGVAREMRTLEAAMKDWRPELFDERAY